MPPAFIVGEDPLPEGASARLGSNRLRHGDTVEGLAFAPNGKLLASTGEDNRVRLWDASTGKLVRVLSGFESGTCKLVFSPDSATLAVATLSNDALKVSLRDVATGYRLADIASPSKTHAIYSCSHIAFSPTGEYLAATNVDAEIVLLHPRTAKEVAKLIPENPVWGAQRLSLLAFSPDGKILAAWGDHRPLCLWDVGRRKQIATLACGDHWIRGLTFTPDGKKLISLGMVLKDPDSTDTPEQATLRTWDVATGKQLTAIEGGPLGKQVHSLALSPDGKTMAVALPGQVQMWDLAQSKLVRALPVSRGPLTEARSLAFSPDGRILAGALGAAVCVWETATGRLLSPLPGDAAHPLSTLAVSADGRLLVSLDQEGSIGLWDLPARRLRRWLHGDGWQARQLVLSADRKTLAAADEKDVYLWDAAGQKWCPLADISLPPYYRIHRIALSADGRLLAAAYIRASCGPTLVLLGIWNLLDGKPVSKIKERRRRGEIIGLAFSADNRCLTVTWDQHSVCYVQPSGKDSFVRWQTYYHGRTGAALSLSEDLLATAGEEEQGIVLHDLKRRRPLRRLPGPYGLDRLLAVSHDGRYLASAPSLGGRKDSCLHDQTLRVFEMASGQEVLCRQLPEHTWAGALAFVPDKPLLMSGMSDSTVLFWDVASPSKQSAGHAEPLSSLWQEMAHPEARRAYRAMAGFLAAPDAAAFLERHLAPLPGLPASRREQLLADLDSHDFTVRESASRELAGWGERILPDLDHVLATDPSLEVRRRLELLAGPLRDGRLCNETLRQMRAVAVLEYLDSPAARKLLKRMSEDNMSGRLGQEARAAWQRSSARQRGGTGTLKTCPTGTAAQ